MILRKLFRHLGLRQDAMISMDTEAAALDGSDYLNTADANWAEEGDEEPTIRNYNVPQ